MRSEPYEGCSVEYKGCRQSTLVLESEERYHWFTTCASWMLWQLLCCQTNGTTFPNSDMLGGIVSLYSMVHDGYMPGYGASHTLREE